MFARSDSKMAEMSMCAELAIAMRSQLQRRYGSDEAKSSANGRSNMQEQEPYSTCSHVRY